MSAQKIYIRIPFPSLFFGPAASSSAWTHLASSSRMRWLHWRSWCVTVLMIVPNLLPDSSARHPPVGFCGHEIFACCSVHSSALPESRFGIFNCFRISFNDQLIPAQVSSTLAFPLLTVINRIYYIWLIYSYPVQALRVHQLQISSR